MHVPAAVLNRTSARRRSGYGDRAAVTLDPLVHAPLIVQAHVATVVPALVLGSWLLVVSRKGSRPHRAAGVLFLALMVTTAILSIFIHRRTPASPLFGMSTTHLFVPFVLFSVWRAIDGARKGNIKQHRAWTTGLFVGALVINGLNNVFFLPGITHDVFFGR
jgi:uncharacterized membrane protein